MTDQPEPGPRRRRYRSRIAAGLMAVVLLAWPVLAAGPAGPDRVVGSLDPAHGMSGASAGTVVTAQAPARAAGWLGVFLAPGNPPVVREVVPGSPAARAGLRAGDAIRAIDGQAVGSIRELASLLQRRKAGDTVRLEVVRDGAVRSIQAVLAERPKIR